MENLWLNLGVFLWKILWLKKPKHRKKSQKKSFVFIKKSHKKKHIKIINQKLAKIKTINENHIEIIKKNEKITKPIF